MIKKALHVQTASVGPRLNQSISCTCHFRGGPTQGQPQVKNSFRKEEGPKHPDTWWGIVCASHCFLLSVLSPQPALSLQNCQHNTEGDHCEQCKDGYVGSHSAEGSLQCVGCPCPLSVASNK